MKSTSKERGSERGDRCVWEAKAQDGSTKAMMQSLEPTCCCLLLETKLRSDRVSVCRCGAGARHDLIVLDDV